MPARSYGRRFDGDAADPVGEQTMRVANAHEYEISVIHYERRVGRGRIRCQTLRAPSGPARRIVQLEAEYVDAGVLTTRIVGCASAEEELRELERLERIILAAERRPRPADPHPAWQRAARGRVGYGE